MKQERQGILHNVCLTCKKRTSLKRKIKCATEARYLSPKHERTLLASLQTVQKQSCQPVQMQRYMTLNRELVNKKKKGF